MIFHSLGGVFVRGTCDVIADVHLEPVRALSSLQLPLEFCGDEKRLSQHSWMKNERDAWSMLADQEIGLLFPAEIGILICHIIVISLRRKKKILRVRTNIRHPDVQLITFLHFGKIWNNFFSPLLCKYSLTFNICQWPWIFTLFEVPEL